MLIVKGKNQKSILANILMDKTNSICFEYHDDKPVVYNSIFGESTRYTLESLLEFIIEEPEALDVESPYDYLIIYTNKKEEELNEFINGLNEHRWRVSFKDILVMCK